MTPFSCEANTRRHFSNLKITAEFCKLLDQVEKTTRLQGSYAREGHEKEGRREPGGTLDKQFQWSFVFSKQF